MNSRKRRIIPLAIALGSLLLFESGCTKFESYYLVGNFENDTRLRELFGKIDKESDEVRFILLREIANTFIKAGQKNKEIYFLTNWVERHPFDAYNAYYLMLVASAYEEMRAMPFALYYYQRIIKNHPDVFANGKNIHFQALLKLIQHLPDNEQKIEYYKMLISRFPDQVEDIGKVYFALAKSYEEVGDWPQAIQTYEKFLRLPYTQIPGIPDAYKKIEEKIDFFNSDYRKWTYDDLSFLVSEVRDAIRAKDTRKLDRYKAKSNFFTMYWEQKNFDETRARYFNITSFLLSSDPKVADSLDMESNANEAYLKTTNWAYRETVWYFYFKKINFPADPSIHGRWEWAGIYFGNK